MVQAKKNCRKWLDIIYPVEKYKKEQLWAYNGCVGRMGLNASVNEVRIAIPGRDNHIHGWTMPSVGCSEPVAKTPFLEVKVAGN
jgi:hypothetical protein